MAKSKRDEAFVTVRVTRASHDLVVEAARLTDKTIGELYSAGGIKLASDIISGEEGRLRSLRERAARELGPP